MIHPGILPEPFPGEHFLGLLGRFARDIGYDSLRYLLWGDLLRRDYPSRENRWPPRLRRMLSGISADSSGQLAETLLLHHSPFGLYDLFYPTMAARRVFARLLGGNKSRPYHEPLDIDSRVTDRDWLAELTLWACRECLESDAAQFGISYWHIEHGLLGAEYCWRHGSPLRAYQGPVGYLPLYEPAKATIAAFRRWPCRPESERNGEYARSVVRLQRLVGTGYIGDQLQEAYAPLIEEIAGSLQARRYSRSPRVQRALNMLLEDRSDGPWYAKQLAHGILRQIVRDIRDGDASFATRMIGLSGHAPAGQLAMQQLGFVDIVEAAERSASKNPTTRTLSACGFPRCRRYVPDYRERLERIRGVKRLAARARCECGFTSEAKSGHSTIEITDFGELARTMLNELLRDGIEDEGTLSRVLSLPPHAIAILRTRVGGPRSGHAGRGAAHSSRDRIEHIGR